MDPAPAPLVVAAFDVDGTLTTRDCVVPFLREFVGTSALVLAVVRRPLAALRAAAARDRDAFKAMAVRACAGRSAADAEALGRRFAAQRAVNWLRPDTSARLAWHRANGHRIVLVSASFLAYLGPMGEHLGVDAVLCTTFEVSADGSLTGRLVGGNCRGPEKVRRLREWLAGESVELWAYGDSNGDRELLAAADHPHYVKDVVVTEVPV
jgi:phosphatidylglycerophosphatase C